MHAHSGVLATNSSARLATAMRSQITLQLRRPSTRRALKVTSCLKCAAAGLNQQVQHQQDHHAARPPTLALAAAGWQSRVSQSSSSRLAAAVGSSKQPPSTASDGLPSQAPQQDPSRTQQAQQQHPQAFPEILDPHSQQQQQQQQQQEAEPSGPDAAADSGEVDSPGVRAALAALKWYKGFLSPSMASTCRFLPTCSQYSMDSYRKYGVAKGTVLTAWRLLRCNPWGGSGIDNTAWPPVGLPPWLFSARYSAEVAVVLGAALFVRFSHALLFE